LIFDYVPVTSRGLYSRPTVDVQLANLIEAPLTCLVDSGAAKNRFHAQFAEAAGISLDEPDDVDSFIIGGQSYTGRIVTVNLKIASFEWEAPVCFVPDWDHDFQILGHEGFFRWFRVCFHAADEQISLEPADR